MADELPSPEGESPEGHPVLPSAEQPETSPVPDAVVPPAAVQTAAPPAPPPSNKQWYVVKVQSGREESIKEAIERRVKIEGLEEYFGEIRIPVEKVTELRSGKRYIKERKLYPGYLMVHVEFNETILYLSRETSGVGDFVGGSHEKSTRPGQEMKPPLPMKPHEVEKMLALGGEGPKADLPAKLRFDRGDRVKVRDGTFAGMEGEVKEIMEAKGAVKVELTIFGRPVPVELEYWQVDPV